MAHSTPRSLQQDRIPVGGDRERGVISYSSGNHAQGVAYAARALAWKPLS